MARKKSKDAEACVSHLDAIINQETGHVGPNQLPNPAEQLAQDIDRHNRAVLLADERFGGNAPHKYRYVEMRKFLNSYMMEEVLPILMQALSSPMTETKDKIAIAKMLGDRAWGTASARPFTAVDPMDDGERVVSGQNLTINIDGSILRQTQADDADYE